MTNPKANPHDAQIRITCYCAECGQMIHAAETHEAPAVVNAPGTFEIEIVLGVEKHECKKESK